MLSGIIAAFCAVFTSTCDPSGNGQDIDVEAARIE